MLQVPMLGSLATQATVWLERAVTWWEAFVEMMEDGLDKYLA